jgi:hypothetical protein
LSLNAPGINSIVVEGFVPVKLGFGRRSQHDQMATWIDRTER